MHKHIQTTYQSNASLRAQHLVSAQHKSDGFTLLELLIAIFLSLLLTAILIQSYLSNKQTYRLTEGVSRVQESIRFGTHFISSDLRQANNIGCTNTIRNTLNDDLLYDLTSPVVGWDHASTTDTNDTYALPALTADGEAPFAANSDLTNGTSTDLPDQVLGSLVEGSDAILIKKVLPTSIRVSNANSFDSNVISIEDEHSLVAGEIFLIGDCLTADLAQHSDDSDDKLVISTSGSLTPGTLFSAGETEFWGSDWNESATVHQLASQFYYIGRGTSGLPSLFRREIDGSTADRPAQELVEGVENMQILYGLDIDSPMDSLPDRFVSANNVDDWSQVASIRIGLLARSPGASTDIDQDGGNDQVTYTLTNVDIQPAGSDRILRYTVNSTIQPRNLALSRSHLTNPADPASAIVSVPTLKVCNANGVFIDPVSGDDETIDCDTFRR